MTTDIPTLIVNGVAAAATLGAVIVALWYGQKQRADVLEAKYDAQRPLIVPDQPLVHRLKTFGGDMAELPKDRDFDFTAFTNTIRLRNAGPGVAINVRAILVGPEPEAIETTPPDHYTIDVPSPVAAEDVVEAVAHRGGMRLRGSVEVVPGYQLYAPTLPSAEEIRRGARKVKYRLTVTCHDIFGKAHAVVYDYVDKSDGYGTQGVWNTGQTVWELETTASRTIKKDLDDLNRAALSNPPHQDQPSQPPSEFQTSQDAQRSREP